MFEYLISIVVQKTERRKEKDIFTKSKVKIGFGILCLHTFRYYYFKAHKTDQNCLYFCGHHNTQSLSFIIHNGEETISPICMTMN